MGEIWEKIQVKEKNVYGNTYDSLEFGNPQEVGQEAVLDKIDLGTQVPNCKRSRRDQRR
jgi:hypothetical protein